MSLKRADIVNQVSKELKEYVSSVGFSSIAILLSYLHWVNEEDGNLENWQPNSLEMIDIYGSTNCVGAYLHFLDRFVSTTSKLEENDFQLISMASPSNRLPNGVTTTEVPYQHMAMMLVDKETGASYIVDPGLGLSSLVPVEEDDLSQIQIAERLYSVNYSGNDLTKLTITKPNGNQLIVDLLCVSSEFDPEEEIQKPLLRATTKFKMDSFDENGYKLASLKIDFFNEKVVFYVYGEMSSYSFDELLNLLENRNFNMLATELNQTTSELFETIDKVVNYKKLVRSIWYEEIQRDYYLHNSDKMSPFETDWQTLADKEYIGGGVVIVLINEKDEVLMYEVPEGKSKSFIGRQAGQLNLFVETADGVGGSDEVSSLESFSANLARAFKEELGIPVIDGTDMVYREVDYGVEKTKVRARCTIYRVDSNIITDINKHIVSSNLQREQPELSTAKWVSLENLGAEWVEPNALSILEKII